MSAGIGCSLFTDRHPQVTLMGIGSGQALENQKSYLEFGNLTLFES